MGSFDAAQAGTRIVPEQYPAEIALESLLPAEDIIEQQLNNLLTEGRETTVKKYVLTLNLAIVDADGETLDTQTETEYFDTLSEAEQAAARYRAEGTAGEYEDAAAQVISAEVSDTPQEVELI